jgi:hypothetical protein
VEVTLAWKMDGEGRFKPAPALQVNFRAVRSNDPSRKSCSSTAEAL